MGGVERRIRAGQERKDGQGSATIEQGSAQTQEGEGEDQRVQPVAEGRPARPRESEERLAGAGIGLERVASTAWAQPVGGGRRSRFVLRVRLSDPHDGRSARRRRPVALVADRDRYRTPGGGPRTRAGSSPR